VEPPPRPRSMRPPVRRVLARFTIPARRTISAPRSNATYTVALGSRSVRRRATRRRRAPTTSRGPRGCVAWWATANLPSRTTATASRAASRLATPCPTIIAVGRGWARSWRSCERGASSAGAIRPRSGWPLAWRRWWPSRSG